LLQEQNIKLVTWAGTAPRPRAARAVNPAVIHFLRIPFRGIFFLKGFRSNGVQACWLNLTQKKINLLSRILFCIPGRFAIVRYRLSSGFLGPTLAGKPRFEKHAGKSAPGKQQEQDRITSNKWVERNWIQN